MKQLSEFQKSWNILHSEHEQRRKIRQRERRLQRYKGIGPYKRVRLNVPTNFDLGDNLDSTLEFFRDLRDVVLMERKFAIVDFSPCNAISAGAGLVLAAEAERCRALRNRGGKPTLTGTYPDDEGMTMFLDDLGFFKQLKVQSPLTKRKRPRQARFIAMRSGRRDIGERLHYVTEVLGTGPVQLDEEARLALYEALLEAMNNVTAHAYPEKANEEQLPVLPGQWWAAGYWDHDQQEIGVLMYDQGVGIPATLPTSRHSPLIQDIRQRLGLGMGDADSIKAAMEVGRSRLDSDHRGHGMASLRHAVDRASEGHLLILSGSGAYLHKTGMKEELSSLRTSIGGTFIGWRIRDDNLITWGGRGRRND